MPASFEIELFIDKEKYKFGCELTDSKVIEEWLFRTKKRRKNTIVFKRIYNNIMLGRV